MPLTTSCRPTLVSSDGSAVAGQSSTSLGYDHAFRWTAADGLQDLGTLGGNSASVQFISSDGAVLVGQSATATGQSHAFRWSSGTGMVDLVPPGATWSAPQFVSSDGAVVIIVSDSSQAQTFRWSASTGFLPLGSVTVRCMSPDGSTVAGSSNGHATLWTSAGGFTDLGTLGGSPSDPQLLSPDGSVVVGVSQTPSQQVHAFKWTSGTGIIDLGTLGGWSSPAFLSADTQVVVGTSLTATGLPHAFRWTSGTGMTDLGTLGGGYSYPSAMSADGLIVIGQSSTATGQNHAFVWTSGTGMADLGTLGGDFTDATFTSADGSVIVGDSATTTGDSHVFRWTASSGMTDIGTLGGADSSIFFVSPDGATLVGQSTTATGQPHAFCWTALSGVTDLTLSGCEQSQTLAMAGGVAVGTGTTSSGELHAFRWTNAQGTIDLGTLGRHPGDGSVYALSKDGAFASALYLKGDGISGVLSLGANVSIDLGSQPDPFSAAPQFVSDDGNTAVGQGTLIDQDGNFTEHLFRWTRTGTVQDMGSLMSSVQPLWDFVQAYDALPDCSVVVGTSYTDNGQQHAFRWTEVSGMTDLGTLPGHSGSWATKVAPDNSFVLGFSIGPVGDVHGFRWTVANGMEDLGTIITNLQGASLLSADGSTAALTIKHPDGSYSLGRWTSAGGLADLGTLGGNFASPQFISSDGSVVVGSSLRADGTSHAFRWAGSSGMVDLGTLGEDSSFAQFACADGSIIVGRSYTRSTNLGQLFRWTAAEGMKSMQSGFGLPLAGWNLFSCVGLSDDGLVMCGNGNNPQGGFQAWEISFRPQPAPVTVTASDASGTYGDVRTVLQAKVTAQSPSSAIVNEGTVTFTVVQGGSTLGITNSGAVINGSASAYLQLGGFGAGNYSITASYNPATSNPSFIAATTAAAGTLTIAPKALTIYGGSGTKSYGQTFSMSLLGYSTVGLVAGDSISALTQTSDGAAPTASVAGSPYAIVPSAPVGISVANYTITYVDGSLVVAKATPVITWSQPANITYPMPLGAPQLNAGANVAGTFAYSPASGTVLSAGAGQSLQTTFTPTDTVDYNNASASTTINVDPGFPIITWPNPADIISGIPLGAAQLDASAAGNLFGNPLAGTFVYTPAAGTILNPGLQQQLRVDFTPANPSYVGISAVAYINVNNTASGTGVSTAPIDSSTGTSPAMLTFSDVTQAGISIISSSSSGTPPPDGFQVGQNQIYYDITSSAQFSGPVQVCFTYAPGTFVNDNNATLFHYQNGAWVNVTTSVDPVNHVVCGSVTSFSPFAIFEQQNQPPVITSLTGPTAPLALASAATVSVSFTDTNAGDKETAQFSWGDGAIDTVNTGKSSGSASGTHVFAAAGVYPVTVTLSDGWGGVTSSTFNYVVIYDPNAGFVTGGGWILSPAGAYVANPALTGQATFGFVSKYQNGASVPTGQTQFHFALANFNFQSTAYQWLVVSGAKAQYKGSGTINGVAGYAFLLTATDGQMTGGGGVDRFRIHIWSSATGATVYDNVPGAADDLTNSNPETIGGGSIVIHQ